MASQNAAPVLPQRNYPRSFEELSEAQRLVMKRRRAYPRKCVDALIAWMVDELKKVVKAEKELFGKAPNSVGDFAVRRQRLLESKGDLLRCAKVPEHIFNYAALLETFIGESNLVILDADCDFAQEQHREWFSSLCNATRHTTESLLTLQTMLAENKWIGAGASSSLPARALSEAWIKTEDAVDAEMKILARTSALETVHFCLRSGMAAAERLKACLSRSKDDYHFLGSLDASFQHAMMFPELGSENDFLRHLETLCGLPLCRAEDDEAADDSASPSLHLVEVDATSMPEFKRLSRHARSLSQRGVAIPLFLINDCKLFAKYAHDGIPLIDLKETYEMSEPFLRRLWNSLASSAAAFEKDVDRIHGAITESNIFVDLVSERITLGPHAVSLHDQEENVGSDMPALSRLVEDLRAANGLVFATGSTLKFRVACSTCASLCLRSTSCPAGTHAFCKECFGNLLQSNTDHNGAMKQVSCPMGCGAAWSDAELLRCLPSTQAEQAHKRRRLHLEIELRRQLREEILAEIAATTQRSQNEESNDQELPLSIISESLEMMTDMCRQCGTAFKHWDGCMAINCPTCGDSYVCGYCLMTGSREAIHHHIGHGECPIRNQMFPAAVSNGDTFHQGPSAQEEFRMARKIRIVEELHVLFQSLDANRRRLLGERIRLDIEQNGIDFSLVYNEEQL